MSHRVLCDELSSTDDWPQAHSEMRLDVGPLPPFSPPPSLFYPALRTSEQFPTSCHTTFRPVDCWCFAKCYRLRGHLGRMVCTVTAWSGRNPTEHAITILKSKGMNLFAVLGIPSRSTRRSPVISPFPSAVMNFSSPPPSPEPSAVRPARLWRLKVDLILNGDAHACCTRRPLPCTDVGETAACFSKLVPRARKLGGERDIEGLGAFCRDPPVVVDVLPMVPDGRKNRIDRKMRQAPHEYPHRQRHQSGPVRGHVGRRLTMWFRLGLFRAARARP